MSRRSQLAFHSETSDKTSIQRRSRTRPSSIGPRHLHENLCYHESPCKFCILVSGIVYRRLAYGARASAFVSQAGHWGCYSRAGVARQHCRKCSGPERRCHRWPQRLNPVTAEPALRSREGTVWLARVHHVLFFLLEPGGPLTAAGLGSLSEYSRLLLL